MNNKMELIFILDQSGSMDHLTQATIDGFNELLVSQQQTNGDALITTVLFDDEISILHDRVRIDSVKPLTNQDYITKGSTALLDTIGMMINRVGYLQKFTPKPQQANKVLFTIMTDGQENASRKYDFSHVRHMIEYQTTKYHWEFVFLGAKLDAEAEAARYGIKKERAVRFREDEQGMRTNYRAMSDEISRFRNNDQLSDEWKTTIDQDYKNRKDKN